MTIPFIPDTQPYLVGRDRELRVLRDHLTAARAGQGSLVLIGGEAGIGKTTLAETLCREAAEHGAYVLIGRCYDLTETPPYGPWVELFARYQSGNDLPSLPPVFAHRGSIGAIASQAALFDQVSNFLHAMTARQPLVLLLDDLHWADAASLELLRFVARALATQSLLLIVTYRADELTRRHPLYTLVPILVKEASAIRIAMHPLGLSDAQALVTARYSVPESDISPLASYLHERSEGNPLFLGELLRTLEEGGHVQATEDGLALHDLAAARVPPLLRQVIEGRLARLDEESQRLLGIAAIIGHDVPLDVWAAVSDVSEDTLLDVVEQGVVARLLAEVPDGERVRFAHALMREALYEALPAARRRRMHKQVGDVFAARSHADPDAVAYHFHKAADARAAAWLVKAGERAQEAWAWLTAAERYEAAARLMEVNGSDAAERAWLFFRLALMRRYGDTAQALAHLDAAGRLAAEVDDPLLTAQVIFYRGNIHCLAGRLGQGVAEMAAGIVALAALPRLSTARRPSIDVASVNGARGTHYTWLGNIGRFAEARALGEQLAAEVVASDPDGMTSGRYAVTAGGLHQTYAYQGEGEAAHRTFIAVYDFRRARDTHLHLGVIVLYALLWEVLPYRADDVAERRRLAAEAEDAWARGSGARTDVPARFARVPVLFLDGEWEEARTLALAGHTRSGDYILSKLFAFTTLGPLAQAQGDAELAAWLVREWLPDGPATLPGNTFYAVTILQRMAATLAIDAGDLSAARTWLEAQDRWLAWSGAVLGQAERHLVWAHYHRAAGDPMLAYKHATQSLAHAREPRQPLALIAAHRMLGELETADGQFAAAARHLAEALILADACQVPYERALTLLADAALRAMTGEDMAALALLDEVRAICTPLGAKPALARADALAASLSAPRSIPVAYPAGLSPREVEVLRLIVAGRTNGDIADALFLSKRTVQVHVAHILAKTNADNRAAAAAFALRHGLA